MPIILSGVFEGKTTGTPISIIIHNEDKRSRDYETIKNKLGLDMLIILTLKNMGLEIIEVVEDNLLETVCRVALELLQVVLKQLVGSKFNVIEQLLN